MLASRYEILRVLGEGGAGTTYVARDRLYDLDVAIKMVRDGGPELRAALRRELRSLAGLSHRGLVRVRDLGTEIDEGAAPIDYLVTDLVVGTGLSQHARGRSLEEVVAPLCDALEGLHYLHRVGLLHGDVKPDNIVVTDIAGAARSPVSSVDPPSGVLLDLGCARALGSVLGEVSGTPGFVAPELFDGQAADARADLFAVGKTIARLVEITESTPSRKMRALVSALVASDPADRPTDVAEVLQALGRRGELVLPPAGKASSAFGREHEMALGLDALDALVAGRTGVRVLWFAGADGIGKSRLLSELRWKAQLRARVVEADATRPGAMTRWLSMASGRTVDERMEAVLDARARINAKARPTVLVMDDVDRLEAREARWLESCVRLAQPNDPTLWLLAGDARPDPMAPTVGSVVALRPLDEGAVARWVGRALSPRRVTELVRVTEGVPARVERALAALAHEPESAVLARCAEERAHSRDGGDATSKETPKGLRGGEIALAAGRAREALSLVAPVLRGARDTTTRGRARLLGASAYLRLGRASRALASLDRAKRDLESTADRATFGDVRARALLALGRYREAEAEARAGLERTDGVARVAALRETLGMAASYLGDHGRAREELHAAASAWAEAGDPRAVVRVRSYEAIAAFREGDLERAVSRHRDALATAETAGLDDQLASVLLNVGTALQQRGDWGEAMHAYERGLRLARALGKTSTEALLGFNLANVFVAIGVVDRAERTLDETAAVLGRDGADGDAATPTKMPALDAAMLALRAEVASIRGELDVARACIEESRRAFERLGAQREVIERALDGIAISLRDDAGTADHVEPDVASTLAEIAGEAERVGAVDLKARAGLLAGRADRRRGDASAAVARLDRVYEGAKHGASPSFLAELEGELAATWDAAGDVEVAAAHRARARARWSRVAIGLPIEMRDAFWRHPLRAELRTRPRVATAAAVGSVRAESSGPSLARVLEINRRLASTLVASEVLGHALDAAIELTRAERGFVLLKKGSGSGPSDAAAFEVVVARNLDRERIGKSHLKFSQGIATAVVQRGEPIVTTDARTDDRFRAHASVHAMKLTSVACVPIRAPEGVLGAIYLDNRFERGRFAAGDVETLQAFADQAAIALRNARLHAALEARTRELELEKERVETLARTQAKELERLHEERRAIDPPSATRHDYRELVGRSAPMRKLLATLDRVVDSPLPVLVSGESGTGKELVARATHVYGPRRDCPFLAVNCAALPEALLESELFGYVRGAFTGADRDHPGLFVAARGGTLFLDEIGETSLAMQAKLLRVLQEREVRPLGATRSTKVDFRLVAATNRRLRDEIAQGRFREDLYYRLAVVEIVVPALRDRLDDLPALARALLDRVARDGGRAAPTFTPDALRLLMRHRWPGNVRELENVLGRALTMTEGSVLTHRDLDLAPSASTAVHPPATRTAHERDEAARILAALRDTSFRVSEVARRLGIPRNTLYRRMRRYGIALRD